MNTTIPVIAPIATANGIIKTINKTTIRRKDEMRANSIVMGET
jgi:hypothetical protein